MEAARQVNDSGATFAASVFDALSAARLLSIESIVLIVNFYLLPICHAGEVNGVL